MNSLSVVTQKLDDRNEFSAWLSEQEDKQKLEFKEDPIALAWAVYRMWIANPGSSRWEDFEHVALTDEDRIKSAEIRKYYADRLIVSMLSGSNISTFRRKLYGVVTDSVKLDKSDIGLLYRLPYFYMEDLALDRVAEQTQPAERQLGPDRITAKFTVIECVLRSRRAGDFTQYWMKSDQHSQAFMMTIKTDNPYHRLISKLLEQPVTLSGNAIAKVHNGHHCGRAYYYLAAIEVAA